MKSIIYLLIIDCLIFIFFSCEREPQPPEPLRKITNMMDSVDMIFEDLYLWNQFIKKQKVENAKDEYAMIGQMLNQTALSAINPQTLLPYEFNPLHPERPKYSTFFLKTKGTVLPKSNYGFAITALPKLNQYRVLYVQRGSKLEKAGVRRGDILKKINGQVLDKVNERNNAFIKNCLNSNQINLEIHKNTGAKISITLNRSIRWYSEVLKDSIIGKNANIGYLALNSFPPIPEIKKELDLIFKKFTDKKISTLIIDLRYNSGGYVSSARYLSNLIIPMQYHGKKMYHLAYNSTLQSKSYKYLHHFKFYNILGKPELKKDGTFYTLADYDYSIKNNDFYFEKKGGLNALDKLYFIVSNQTASSSELLINNLIPYITCKLVGKRTFGKPVGYFPVELHNYSFYLSSFLAFNAKSSGTYYQGFPADYPCEDDPTADFGTIEDPAVRIIFNALNITDKKEARTKFNKEKNVQPHQPLEKNPSIGLIHDDFQLESKNYPSLFHDERDLNFQE